ncbi:MAG: hypothetical protein M3R51_04290 [Candidatus Eremiobacteraeota bacterium]|nr:hypothetical protein [Candidatus Eremiobacteraeota bacterium]
MSDLPQPAYVSYGLESQSDGLQIALITVQHLLWLSIESGSSPSHWLLRHRTNDYASEVVNIGDNRRYVTHRSFFDPTWYGSYRALRDGMLGYQDIEKPLSELSTAPAAAPPTILKTIAVTAVMGPGIYDVHDNGTATCNNGDPGHALHLTPRTSDPKRQLTDAVVDLTSMRFCTIRYSWPSGFGFHGTVEEHFSSVGGYWMQTDGILDGTLRAFGISMHHGIWRYRLTNMQFPSTLPPQTFIRDPRQ